VVNNGPLVMEMATYRYHGHSMSDPGTSYRTRDEVQEVRKNRDPIGVFKEVILGSGLVTGEEIKKIEDQCKKEVLEAGERAKVDPELPVEELYNHIIVDPPQDMRVRGCDDSIWAATQ